MRRFALMLPLIAAFVLPVAARAEDKKAPDELIEIDGKKPFEIRSDRAYLLFRMKGKWFAPVFMRVPTTAEVGFAEIDFSNWVGTVVSAKLPADIVGKINIATVKAAMSPKVRDRLIAAGFEPTVSDSPDKLAQMVKADYERNAQIVKAFNIQLNQ